MLEVIERVPTYEGRVQLIPVAGGDGLYDMMRADEPTVIGTPFNKALFDSIAADLAMIAPPIEATAGNIAQSTNVACYDSLTAAGLLVDSSVNTGDFLENMLPPHSAVFCSVQGDGLSLADLPSQQGTLFLMKGSSKRYVSGCFASEEGAVYSYSYVPGEDGQGGGKAWSELAMKGYVDGLVGDIGEALDKISGEVI